MASSAVKPLFHGVTLEKSWGKEKFRIFLGDAEFPRVEMVEGWCSRPYCFGLYKHKRGWRLTHLMSGHQLGSYRTLKIGKTCAQELAIMPIDWGSSRLDLDLAVGLTDQAYKFKAWEIMTKYRREY